MTLVNEIGGSSFIGKSPSRDQSAGLEFPGSSGQPFFELCEPLRIAPGSHRRDDCDGAFDCRSDRVRKPLVVPTRGHAKDAIHRQLNYRGWFVVPTPTYVMLRGSVPCGNP